jgi:hypothetical protein
MACLLSWGVASADQCAVVSRGEGARAAALLKLNTTIVAYCEPCGDKKPEPGKTVISVELRQWDNEDDEVEVFINGEPTDLAYVFLRAANGAFNNVAKLVGCKTTGVSAKLPQHH